MAASRKDASLERAALRKSHIPQAVMSGDLGAKARNAIQRRKEMKALIDETRAYYEENLPYTFVYDPTLQEGKIDYQKETLTVWFKAVMILNSNVIDDANMLERALKANPEYEEWGLGIYLISYPILFPQVSIVNGKGEAIGEGTAQFSMGRIGSNSILAARIGSVVCLSMCHNEILIEIPASKDMDGMYIRIDGIDVEEPINNDGKGNYYGGYDYVYGKTVGILTKDEYIEEVLKPAIRASDAGKGTLPPAVNEAGKYFGWNLEMIRSEALKSGTTTQQTSSPKTGIEDVQYKFLALGNVKDSYDEYDGSNLRFVCVPIATANMFAESGKHYDDRVGRYVTSRYFEMNELYEHIRRTYPSLNNALIDEHNTSMERKERQRAVRRLFYGYVNSIGSQTIMLDGNKYLFLPYYISVYKISRYGNRGEVVYGIEEKRMLGGDVTIPAKSINGVVCGIGVGAFKDCTFIESVTLPSYSYPESFCVDDFAFEGCTSLKKVTLPTKGSIRWGKNVFKGCKSLSKSEQKKLKAAGYKGKF